MTDKEQNGARAPKILKRTETPLSQWASLVAKDIQFAASEPSHAYHCLAQADYVVVLARTRKGLIPIVRQYRPAVEAYTWELPGGLVDPGETPENSCRREIMEETGMQVESMEYLGSYQPDTGRLENHLHAYCARLSDPVPNFKAETGIEVDFVSTDRLIELVREKKFQHQLHIGVLFLAQLLVPEWKSLCKSSA